MTHFKILFFHVDLLVLVEWRDFGDWTWYCCSPELRFSRRHRGL